MNWSAAYVGIPHVDHGRTRDGADCLGLAHLVLAEQTGCLIPTYDGRYTSADERAEIAALIRAEETSPLWLPVLGRPNAFDLVFFRHGQHRSHCGIVVRPGLMLHVARGASAVVERYDPAPAGLRLTDIVRWHELGGPPA